MYTPLLSDPTHAVTARDAWNSFSKWGKYILKVK